MVFVVVVKIVAVIVIIAVVVLVRVSLSMTFPLIESLKPSLSSPVLTQLTAASFL